MQALRRDLAGAAARMSDMTGELSDKQKQKLEQYEERIRDQDSELEGQRKQLVQLSALVDEQQKEINSREDKLTEQQKVRIIKTRQILHPYACPVLLCRGGSRLCFFTTYLTITNEIGKFGPPASLCKHT